MFRVFELSEIMVSIRFIHVKRAAVLFLFLVQHVMSIVMPVRLATFTDPENATRCVQAVIQLTIHLTPAAVSMMRCRHHSICVQILSFIIMKLS
jgi:hypothetical protein